MSLRAYLRNVRWGQVLFGALLALLALDFGSRLAQGRAGEFGTALRGFGLVALFLAFWVYLGNLYRHGLVPDYSLRCRYCGGPVNRYSEFCEHCGADLIAEEKLQACGRCGTAVYEGTRHCPECGASIGGKGGRKGKGRKEPPPQEGWDEPIDALTGLPPERER